MTDGPDQPAAADWLSDEGEIARQGVLREYQMEHAGLEDQLDRLSTLAAKLCAAPIALVSLIGKDTQEFFGRSGFDADRTPRDRSFCAFAMHGNEAMIVPDAREDLRFRDNPLVTGAPGIRFYAGHPLVSPEGAPLGSLCVIDTEPRAGLTPEQTVALATLAEAVMALLDRPRDKRQREYRIAELEQRFEVLVDAIPQPVWATQPNGSCDYVNARWSEYTGQSEAESLKGGWLRAVHPDDLPVTRSAWEGALAGGKAYQTQYRLRRHDGEYRWMVVHGLPILDSESVITRWIGSCTDIHEQTEAHERLDLLSQELSHRIKNIFAVIAGLLSLSLRGRPEHAELGRELQGRILALGRAHDSVRPSRTGAPHSSLAGMLGRLFEAYNGDVGQPRVRIVGDDVAIDDRSATPFALFFHELATNATKYGALSVSDGSVELTVTAGDEEIVLEWRENGGPTVGVQGEPGFGHRLMDLSVTRQLGGKLVFDWKQDGLVVTARVPSGSMRRQPVSHRSAPLERQDIGRAI